MRHIPKVSLCTAFEMYKSTRAHRLRTWDDFNDTTIKLALHQHLWAEQKGLCIYCQQEIPAKISINATGNIHPSHIEHIRPKSESHYVHLSFEHTNLSVSCEGFDIQRPPSTLTPTFCGHPKANHFDEDLFLHPFENEYIGEYFTYNIQGQISGSGKEDVQANYMINLLGLHHPTLNYMREQVYLMLIQEINDNNLDIDVYLSDSYSQLPAFYSMLKQLFGIS